MKIFGFQIVNHLKVILVAFVFLFNFGWLHTSFAQVDSEQPSELTVEDAVNEEENEKSEINGKAIFDGQCARCHQIHKAGAYPKLFKVRENWKDEPENIYEWVKNNGALRLSGKSKRANQVFADYKGAAMPNFNLSDEEIKATLDWIDSQPETTNAGNQGSGATGSEQEEEEEGIGWIWYIIGSIFITIILAVGGVRRQLRRLTSNAETMDKSTYTEEFRGWAWRNRKYVGIGSIVIVMSLLVIMYNVLGNINVMEGYQPSQPIAFPHDVHVTKNGIDCKYCHNSVEKSKTAGIPSVNVCMNCHKYIKGEDTSAVEIAKIYKAAGWDPNEQKYMHKENPIVWNKVHILPDHVYFNHSQHVVAGGLDCAQCHGEMGEMRKTAKVQPHEVLNEVERNKKDKIHFSKPTLTMGWCIECHGQYKVTKLGDGSNAYYQELHERLKKESGQKTYKRYLNDNKGVSVAELGGWECAKCHY